MNKLAIGSKPAVLETIEKVSLPRHNMRRMVQ
jgi:hypothetical protein